ncbi:hypothetical protein [Zavarzinella formosa]|uniref:hypothetical protein n=2 Tax=Zavarzinella formosa TaxID=360055 RepID=UPI0002D9DC54|nr:hypothetical protein [Zavarzinella formosa]
MEATEVIVWSVGGVAAAGATIAAYINGRSSKAIDIGKENQVDIARLRAHVSENYTTKDDTRTLESKMQHTLDRVHSKIEAVDAKLDQMPQMIFNIMRGGQ